MKARVLSGGSYGDIWNEDFILKNWNNEINGELVSEWIVVDALPSPSMKTPIWRNSDWVEGMSTEEIQAKIQKELHEKETEKYLKRSADGARMYAGLSAEFRMAKENGIITEENYKATEKLLIPTRNEVLAGQWISGLNELETLGSDIIGESLFDRLHGIITGYILESY